MTTNQMDEEDSDHLDEVNEELSEGLERCQSMLEDYRSKLIEIAVQPGSNPASPSA